MNKNLLFVGVLLVMGVVAVSGCTSQYIANTITIQNTAFSPTTLNIKPGTTVTWINKDNETQDIVSNSGIFDSGNLTTNQSYNYTFNQSGNYPFHSIVNSNLTGTIVVSSTINNSSTSNSSATGY
jgi:plastocyanin